MHGAGIDMQDVHKFSLPREDLFLEKNFTPLELDYCFSFSDPAPHLAGFFCAKEAVGKALEKDYTYWGLVEIRHKENGAPEAWRLGKKLEELSVSISHTKTSAVAIALLNR